MRMVFKLGLSATAAFVALAVIAPLVHGARAAAGGGGAAEKRTANRATVEGRLRALKELPTTAEAWGTAGQRVDEVLVEIALDAKVEFAVRARAVSALRYFPTPVARRFLENTLREKASSTDRSDMTIVRRALIALGWLGGPDVPPQVAPLLEHPDADVRADAIAALGLTRLAAAADLLNRRLASETLPRLQGLIRRQIKAIDDALRGIAPPPDRSPGRPPQDGTPPVKGAPPPRAQGEANVPKRQ
jgi:HEAT repeat protein